MKKEYVTIDGNQAVAHVAYRTNEVIAIYPITPSSAMGEHADEWSAAGQPNIWGTAPEVIEMQSEAGAAGVVHGALQTGSLTTTFTASQGLLLMIPNMYKIAGELTSTVFHVAARSVATQALSIFGDHSDVMAVRATGFGMLSSNSVQEAMDFALIAQMATLEARVPFLHFFDGFRTSHEVSKVELISDEHIAELIDNELVRAHRARGLSPDNPFIRGTSQNPDVFFQARESVNSFYLRTPAIMQAAMDRFAALVGRHYRLYDYVGAEDAERVIVMMGSGAETAEETVNQLIKSDEKVGLLKVRLYRPFAMDDFVNALPATVKSIAVLDRTKEPGATGEPLYLDVVAAISESMQANKTSFSKLPKIIGGRYGLSSKEFTPAMVKGIFDELSTEQPKQHFTIGINDDVTHMSLDYDPLFATEQDDVTSALFYGLGSDGTVGANKNTIKIIGEQTQDYAQGYFVYDSKKAGTVTVSHLRFGPKPIQSSYLITSADFVALHQFNFLERINVLAKAKLGGTFLLNSPYSAAEVWAQLPATIQRELIDKRMKFYVIDAYKIARETGMGRRINTIMQVCFFSISGVMSEKKAIANIKKMIKKTYGKRGAEVVSKNNAAVDQALSNLFEVDVLGDVNDEYDLLRPVPKQAPAFVQDVIGPIIAGYGDALPVSAMPVDGTYPSGTTKWEKRNLSSEIPVWETDTCIQCGKCVFVCPHAVIREKIVTDEFLVSAPQTFKYADARWKEFKGSHYTLQVSPQDCTGCELCVEICPVVDKSNPGFKALNMASILPLKEQETANWDFFLELPEVDRTAIKLTSVKNTQLLQPLFEFSGACSGCGETPYIKLVTQLFGDRAIIANATGCSSIFGGNLPTTPWSQNNDARGPAWSNSLFEDNAEFGLGMRVTLDKRKQYAHELLKRLESEVGTELVESILSADQSGEIGIENQRERIDALKAKLTELNSEEARELESIADVLVEKSVWIIGGDGWAYDIGFSGLDHVLASGRNVNILVLDTEVYSNTGGQSSKATPRGAVARFAAIGKDAPKKDLGMIAMTYGNVYVAQIAMGANDKQSLQAILEAEAYPGPSLVIAYSHCIAHGIDMTKGLTQQDLAVKSGYWQLYRYNPMLKDSKQNPLILDSKDGKIPFEDYAYNEIRYRSILNRDEQRAEKLMNAAKNDILTRRKIYKHLAGMSYSDNGKLE